MHVKPERHRTRGLLDVLHLLAQLLDQHLHVDRDVGQLQALPTSSPACWLRDAAPGSGNRAACRLRRPRRAAASISSRCEPSRASSSATSMRSANAAASLSARSRSDSAITSAPRQLPQRLVPAFEEALLLPLHHGRDERLGLFGQRAQLLHAFAQHVDQARAFARTRFAQAPRAHSRAACSAASSAGFIGRRRRRHHCRTSCTRQMRARFGSHACTVASRRASRLSCSGAGCGKAPTRHRAA